MAAYTDELGCIALLRFPQWLMEEHELPRGGRLLTVNAYLFDTEPIPDLLTHNRYTNFYPVIPEFGSHDRQRIAERKTEICEEEWERCERMGHDYLVRFPQRWRDGSPQHRITPAEDSAPVPSRQSD